MKKEHLWQNIETGLPIPAGYYADQPYLVKTDDGAWLCCITTGDGREGASGQHIQTSRSLDMGRTWGDFSRPEPPGAVENSYAVLLKAPGGRIFLFYNRNSDNVRSIQNHSRTETITRVDCLGEFGFKYSDDHGKSWSDNYHPIPFRSLQCDRDNIYGGEIRFFWNVGRPFHLGNEAFVSLIRVGEMGRGFYQKSEGSLLNSPDLFRVSDPADATWITLPDGEFGLKTPPGGGPIAEEQCFVPLSDGSIYVTYRTIDGYPVNAYSRDGGRSWSEPAYMLRGNGRPVKHPRAANFVWKCANGKYLYWFHNHGGPFIANHSNIVYDDRNPVWLLPGAERDTPKGRIIVWGEPEMLFYHREPMVRISYPDLLEDDGRYFISETEKHHAAIHEIPPAFLEKMWDSLERLPVPPPPAACFPGGAIVDAPPELPGFYVRDNSLANHAGSLTGEGFAFRVKFADLPVAGWLLDGRQRPDLRGIGIELTEEWQIALTLDDGCEECRMRSERFSRSALAGGVLYINIDSRFGIVTFVLNGVFADGGDELQFGWRRFDRFLVRRPVCAEWVIAPSVAEIAFFNRALMSCECR